MNDLNDSSESVAIDEETQLEKDKKDINVFLDFNCKLLELLKSVSPDFYTKILEDRNHPLYSVIVTTLDSYYTLIKTAIDHSDCDLVLEFKFKNNDKAIIKFRSIRDIQRSDFFNNLS